MKKEQVFFKDTQFVGSEVENVQELFKAIAAGMSFAAEDGHTYYPYYEEDYVNEDGETETREVEMNEDELFELMKADLDKGLKVYAGIYVDGSKYNVVPASNTNLRSSFYIHQKVYFMKDNEIKVGRIKFISLCEGSRDKYSNSRVRQVAMELYKARPYSNSTTGLTIPFNELSHDIRDEFYNAAEVATRCNFVYVEYKDKNNTKEISLDFEDIWSSKEDLIQVLTAHLD